MFYVHTYKHILQYLKLAICVNLMPLCPENHRVMPKITNRKLLFPSIASRGWVFSVINMDGKQVLESVGGVEIPHYNTQIWWRVICSISLKILFLYFKECYHWSSSVENASATTGMLWKDMLYRKQSQFPVSLGLVSFFNNELWWLFRCLIRV